MFSLLIFLTWPGETPVITVMLLLLLKINIMLISISSIQLYSVWETFVHLTSLQGVYIRWMREQ